MKRKVEMNNSKSNFVKKKKATPYDELVEFIENQIDLYKKAEIKEKTRDLYFEDVMLLETALDKIKELAEGER
jgi:hypothetical protein